MKIHGTQIETSTISSEQLVEALKQPVTSKEEGDYKRVLSLQYNPTTGDLKIVYEV